MYLNYAIRNINKLPGFHGHDMFYLFTTLPFFMNMLLRSRLISPAQHTCKFWQLHLPHYIRKTLGNEFDLLPMCRLSLLRRGLRFVNIDKWLPPTCFFLYLNCCIYKVIEPCASTDIVRLCSLLLWDLYDLQRVMFPQLRLSIFKLYTWVKFLHSYYKTMMVFNLLMVN